MLHEAPDTPDPTSRLAAVAELHRQARPGRRQLDNCAGAIRLRLTDCKPACFVVTYRAGSLETILPAEDDQSWHDSVDLLVEGTLDDCVDLLTARLLFRDFWARGGKTSGSIGEISAATWVFALTV